MSPLTDVRVFADEQERRIRQALLRPFQRFQQRPPAPSPSFPVEQQPHSWHGTLTGYKTHFCRCYECRRANADYHRHLRAREAEYAARARQRSALAAFREQQEAR